MVQIIQLGRGEIDVGVLQLKGDDDAVVLTLEPRPKVEIGTYSVGMLPLHDDTVLLRFTAIESIDVLCESLAALRKLFVEKVQD